MSPRKNHARAREALLLATSMRCVGELTSRVSVKIPAKLSVVWLGSAICALTQGHTPRSSSEPRLLC